MNYVISIVTPEALPRLEELTEELALPLNVTLLGYGTAIQSMLDFLGIESNEKPSIEKNIPRYRQKSNMD